MKTRKADAAQRANNATALAACAIVALACSLWLVWVKHVGLWTEEADAFAATLTVDGIDIPTWLVVVAATSAAALTILNLRRATSINPWRLAMAQWACAAYFAGWIWIGYQTQHVALAPIVALAASVLAGALNAIRPGPATGAETAGPADAPGPLAHPLGD